MGNPSPSTASTSVAPSGSSDLRDMIFRGSLVFVIHFGIHGEGVMKDKRNAIKLLGTFCVLALSWQAARPQTVPGNTVQVHLVITDMAQRMDKQLPAAQ